MNTHKTQINHSLSLFFIRAGKVINSIMLLCIISSCEEFIQVDPPVTQLSSSSVFTDDASASSALSGLFSKMMENQSFTSVLTTTMAGMSSGEFVSPASDPFYTNELSSSNSSVQQLWRDAYMYIYDCNAILEGLSKSTGVTPPVKQQLEGEARFVRAFCYFYLVNFFGDVPLTSSTSYESNAVLKRSPEADVYSFLTNDLLAASSLLPSADTATERVRPSNSAAHALLSRVYLYNKDYVNAIKYASLVIDNTSQYSLVSDLNDVFLKNSSEAIWQLMPVASGYNTYEANAYILFAAPTLVSLDDELVSSFEPGDLRALNWIGSFISEEATYHYAYKYKVVSGAQDVSEYYMILRLAEQYLIRSEARAQSGDLAGALSDLNVIRVRAGLSELEAADKPSLLNAIETERRHELMAEWGHYWFDIKRTGRANEVLALRKGSTWQPTDVLYPIPKSELLLNPALAPQNSGY